MRRSARSTVAFTIAALTALLWSWTGAPGGAQRIQRTATTELWIAGAVLLLTAILVSVPSPKLPH